MAQRQITYPNQLSNFNSFRGNLYPSKYPTFAVYQALASTYSPNATVPTNKYLSITLLIQYQNVLQDIKFSVNGINYSNSTIINGRNIFMKSGDYDTVRNSLYNMFLLNGTLEDFDLVFVDAYQYTNDKYLKFNLVSKMSGANVDITVSNYNSITEFLDRIQYYYYSPSNILLTAIQYYNIVKGNNVSEDVDNYEIGVDIYKLKISSYFNQLNQPFVSYNKKYVTTLSKKGFGLADFDLSQVISNSIESWRPTITDFSISVNKYIEYFQIEPYQKYLDKRYDPNNTYTDIHYNQTNNSNLYAIDSYYPIFENYDNTKYGYNAPTAQRNLEFENSGTYGQVGLLMVYDRNLTRQPKYKKLNKSYELLSNQVVLNHGVSVGQLLSDKVYFTFSYSDGSTETIILNTTQNLKQETLRYINQLCFNVSTLKNYITGDFSLVREIHVNFYHPNYAGYFPVKYETQSYYIDDTSLVCDDNTEDEEDYTVIVFKNSRGGFDIFEFEAIQEVATSRKYDSITTPYSYQSNEVSEFEKIYNLDYSKVYTTKTKVLTNIEFDWLEDLIKSTEVYILNRDNLKLYPIIIQNSDYGFKISSDRVINITFNYSRKESL